MKWVHALDDRTVLEWSSPSIWIGRELEVVRCAMAKKRHLDSSAERDDTKTTGQIAFDACIAERRKQKLPIDEPGTGSRMLWSSTSDWVKLTKKERKTWEAVGRAVAERWMK